MVSEDRNDRIEDLLIDYHETRSIPSACEACDLLFEELMSPEYGDEEEGEENMCKKIEVEEESKEKKLRDLGEKRKEAKKELEAIEEKIAGIEDEMNDLLKEIIADKIVVVEERHETTITPVPVVIMEPRRRWPYGWDVWC